MLCPKTINCDFPVWKKLLGHIPKEGEEEEEEDEDDFWNQAPDLDWDGDNFRFNLLAGMNVAIGQFVFQL